MQKYGRFVKRKWLKLEMPLDKLAEFLAVFIAHMHEFDPAAVGPDVADHGGEVNLAKAGADFQLDGVADTEFPRGLEISAAQANGLYSRKPCWSAFDLGAQR